MECKVKNEYGTIFIAEDVMLKVVGYAALECYGVTGMATTDEQTGIARLLPANKLRKGIGVSSADGHVIVSLHVIVEQGVNMASVVNNLASSVKFLLKQIAELDGVDVHVHIEGMRAS